MTNGQAGLIGAGHRMTGPGAGALKYDLLTGLLALAAHDSGTEGRLALRLSLLITARFNWRLGTFAVGQREMARLWGVTERTAKREVAAMRGLRWIEVHRPAARGRVAEHRIAMARVLASTMPYWNDIGPDYAARMNGTPAADPGAASNVVPLHRTEPTVPETEDGLWAEMARELVRAYPNAYSAWFAPLRMVERTGNRLILEAPTSFHANYVETHFKTLLMAACAGQDRGIRDLRIIARQDD